MVSGLLLVEILHVLIHVVVVITAVEVVEQVVQQVNGQVILTCLLIHNVHHVLLVNTIQGQLKLVIHVAIVLMGNGLLLV